MSGVEFYVVNYWVLMITNNLNFMSNTLSTFLEVVNLDTCMNLFFHQGATANNTITVQENLNQ
jgi:hypothetical protein